jgi:2-methylisocitrate lyase-like PEP mutase family enzyme
VTGKLLAAIDGRRDPDFMVIARTDALRVTASLDETIARIGHYAQAGIDAAMVLDLGIEMAPRVRKALPDLPLIWIGGISEPVPSVTELNAAGFCMAVYPFNTVAAVTESVMGSQSSGTSSVRPRSLTRRPERRQALLKIDLP